MAAARGPALAPLLLPPSPPSPLSPTSQAATETRRVRCAARSNSCPSLPTAHPNRLESLLNTAPAAALSPQPHPQPSHSSSNLADRVRTRAHRSQRRIGQGARPHALGEV